MKYACNLTKFYLTSWKILYASSQVFRVHCGNLGWQWSRWFSYLLTFLQAARTAMSVHLIVVTETLAIWLVLLTPHLSSVVWSFATAAEGFRSHSEQIRPLLWSVAGEQRCGREPPATPSSLWACMQLSPVGSCVLGILSCFGTSSCSQEAPQCSMSKTTATVIPSFSSLLYMKPQPLCLFLRAPLAL